MLIILYADIMVSEQWPPPGHYPPGQYPPNNTNDDDDDDDEYPRTISLDGVKKVLTPDIVLEPEIIYLVASD